MYVDGFVLAVPKSKLEAYRALAQVAGTVWKEHGALSYVECLGDDIPDGKVTSFPLAVKKEDDEIVVFSWVTYADRASRDTIIKKVMEDPRMKDGMENMPFDGQRLIYGGFEALIVM